VRGVEGGIPYGQPAPRLVVHRSMKIMDKPLCATTSGHYQTSTNAAHVTCRTCKDIGETADLLAILSAVPE